MGERRVFYDENGDGWCSSKCSDCSNNPDTCGYIHQFPYRTKVFKTQSGPISVPIKGDPLQIMGSPSKCKSKSKIIRATTGSKPERDLTTD